MSSPFTLTIDWLAFTLPAGSVKDTVQMVGGDWTKSDTGYQSKILWFRRPARGRC